MEPLVIARAPGHLSLGWDDMPSGGVVGQDERLTISVAVNYYAYAIVSPCHADDARITVAGCHTLPAHVPDDSPWGGDLTLPQAILRLFGARERLSVFLSTQAPLGIGLGLSGSLTVSMIKALAFSCGLDLDPQEVADLACYVTADTSCLHIDDAHQYAAACGGLNGIYVSNDKVQVDPLRMTTETYKSLDRHLMLFERPSFWRSSADDDGNAEVSHRAAGSVVANPDSSRGSKRHVRVALERGDWKMLGELLQWGWLERCRLANVSSDDLFVQSLLAAKDNGAFGGQGTRVTDGLLVLLCPEERQCAVTETLNARGLQRLPIALESEGVQVLEAVPHVKLRSILAVHEPAQLGSRSLQLG